MSRRRWTRWGIVVGMALVFVRTSRASWMWVFGEQRIDGCWSTVQFIDRSVGLWASGNGRNWAIEYSWSAVSCQGALRLNDLFRHSRNRD